MNNENSTPEIPADDEEFSIFGEHGKVLQEVAKQQRKQWNLKNDTTKLSEKRDSQVRRES